MFGSTVTAAVAAVAVLVSGLSVIAGAHDPPIRVQAAVAVQARQVLVAPPPHSNGQGPGTDNGSFTIVGSAEGMYPGASVELLLELSNPHPFAIEVTAIDVAVAAAGPDCAAGNLVAPPFSGSLLIPRNDSRTVALVVSMVPDAANACQGATFPLTFSGTAVKAQP